MQKCIALALSLLFTFTYRGCSAPPQTQEEVPSFSYAEEVELYSEESVGVQYDGFVNTSELEYFISDDLDAVDQAAKECTFDWSKYTAYYDSEASVWKIVFEDWGNTPEEHEYQTIYMSEAGKTLLIVYGEE
jgi:hypothetical protein